MRLRRRLAQFINRREFEAELEEELRLHREMAEEAAARAGATPDDARCKAGIAFGSAAIALEDSRAAWSFLWLESVLQDIRYAWRGFRKSPGFSVTVIGTLALGLGVLASAYSVFNALVLRPYAVRDPYSLYKFLGWGGEKGGGPVKAFSWNGFKELRKNNAVFADVAGYGGTLPVGEGGDRHAVVVTGNYFGMLGARICLGRPIQESDDVPGDPVAVASYAAWKSQLGGDATALGRKVRFGKWLVAHSGGYADVPVEVVGVACPEFNGVERERVDYWVSLPYSGAFKRCLNEFSRSRECFPLNVVGRFKPGMTKEGAEAAMLAYGRAFPMYPEMKPPGSARLEQSATVYPLNWESISVFLPIFAAFALVLLIACANVSNMMLARGLARRREIAIRISLGAGRARIVRQLLTEGLLLAAPAALAAFYLARGVIRGALWLQEEVLHSYSTMSSLYLWNAAPDWRVLLLLVAAAAGAALLFGLAPALQTARTRVADASRGESSDHRSTRLRSALVLAQVGLCAVLLSLAVVALRAERKAASRDLGVRTDNVFVVMASARPIEAMDLRAEADRLSLYTQLLRQKFSESPQVSSVCEDGRPPAGHLLRGNEKTAGGLTIGALTVSADYFGFFGIPIRGRNFTAEENVSSAPVVILTETAARRIWPRGDALGRVLQLSDEDARGMKRSSASWPPASALVVGIVPDSGLLYGSDDDSGRDQGVAFYPPGGRRMALMLVRMRGDAASALRALQGMVAAVAPSAVAGANARAQIIPVQPTVDYILSPYRALLAMSVFLGALALAMTVSGVFGVSSYAVAQRKKEFGIRMALGATRAQVTRMVLRQSATLAAAGAAVGALAAFRLSNAVAGSGWLWRALSRTMGMLNLSDPTGYIVGCSVVLAAAVAASWIPARRAVRMDPAQTLRCD